MLKAYKIVYTERAHLQFWGSRFLFVCLFVCLFLLLLLLLFFIWEIFTSVLPDGFQLESEWQQVSSSLQDSSQYSGRSK